MTQKRLFVWTALIAAMMTFASQTAVAQDTLGLYFDDPLEGLQRFGHTPEPGVPFEVVVVTKVDSPTCAAEFVITELTVVQPGIFKIGTFKINDTPLDLGDNAVGEYYMAWGFGGCPVGAVELVRVQYADFASVGVPTGTVLSPRGYQPGDSLDSSFDGEMGYITALDQAVVLEPEPWSEYGMPPDAGLAGAVVLNPGWLPVETGLATLSSLKARY